MTARLRSGTSGVDLTGAIPIISGAVTALLSGSDGQCTMPYNPGGWCETGVGELLNLIITGSGGAAHGCLVYKAI